MIENKTATTMKKSVISSIAAVTAILCACERQVWKESYEQIVPSIPANQEKDIDMLADPDAALYCLNLAEIIKATTIGNPETRAQGRSEAAFYTEHANEYPALAKLAGIAIETEDGTPVNYFDLPDEQRTAFIDEYMKQEATDIGDKLRNSPRLRTYVAGQNTVVSRNLDACRTKSGELTIDNQERFFGRLTGELNELALNYIPEKTETRGSTASQQGMSGEYTISKIKNIAKKGDIILTLPNNDNPYSLVDFGKGNMFKFGHAGIFYEDITDKTKKNHFTTIECLTEYGVNYTQLEHWDCENYVLGLCTKKTKWVWAGLKSHLETETVPVENQGLLRNEARKYVGHQYVYWYEFLTAKWSAPVRFTCTTLVWFCAKEQYGIDLSSWLSPLVTPSDILMSNNTYLKTHVY